MDVCMRIAFCFAMFLILPLQLFGQVSFDKVEIRTAFAKAKEGDEGRLLVDGNRIAFAGKKGLEHFSIPTKAVRELFYSRVSGRRIMFRRRAERCRFTYAVYCRGEQYGLDATQPTEIEMKGIQFLVDEKGERSAVLIDLKKHSRLWEDFYDRAIARSRKGEPRESLESVKKHLLRLRRRHNG
jgi:hypothetical protein